MLHRMALLAIAAPRRILLAAALFLAVAAVFAIPTASSLSSGGFQDPSAESSRATRILGEKFGQGDIQLLFLVTSADGALGPAARAAGLDVVNKLVGVPHVSNVRSPWTSPPSVRAGLVSGDGRSGMIVADVAGGERDAPRRAQALAAEVSGSVLPNHPGVTVQPGGPATVYAQISSQTERDVMVMESIAVPVSFVVLVWVFGGLLTAALPIVVGGLAIVGSISVLRLIAMYTEVSIFALSLSAALGLALAIDYTLLIVSRYRDELFEGTEHDEALVRTMRTAGRTVVFSATTVALSTAVMALFPMPFLRSFAYAGVATVVLCALSTLVVAPAAIVLLGPRIDALDVRRGIRRLLRRDEQPPRPASQSFWYRWTKTVMRRSVVIGLAGAGALILLGLPFLGVKWGFPDDRVLPPTASAHQVGDRLRSDFATNSETAVTVVIPDADGLTPADLDGYGARLSRVHDVSAVSTPTGTFVGGEQIGPSTGASGISGGSAYLTVGSDASLLSDDSDVLLDRLHDTATPGDRTVLFTGMAQIDRDSVDAITSRMPIVLAVIAAITFVLLFLLTGSVVLPVKALILNVLSLTASFGALVWIFQDGHLGALGTSHSGVLVVNIPVLLFCIAFGLSMDYEVFLIARIREYWMASEGSDADNDESVALGLAHTGRVVTAAALIMCISFAGLIAAQVSFMRMFGVGLTLAVAVDATLVRMVLVPAFMHILGRWNWWAPSPLRRLHDHIGLTERA
ncbi:MMPL family transporter [Mycolicibacterium komossense]|uniref:MMPL family transporter n=1 Tax=Mycolicibacterium komossense TaxID=1779 RepID=A0ABT3CMG4_9MYCO|nr:MMPL family transporter [Mycolicibacterium komossense]MCV7230744.1 MMPL family transporter [Mycolicibacterium komossense]